MIARATGYRKSDLESTTSSVHTTSLSSHLPSLSLLQLWAIGNAVSQTSADGTAFYRATLCNTRILQ